MLSFATLGGDRERHGIPSGIIFEAEVPGTVPSLNLLLRRHWMKRRAISKRWQWTMLASRPQPYSAPALARVTITRFSRGTLDVDNLYGAAKIVVDALKVAGLIVDDAPKVLELICRQERASHAATHITIERLTGIC
jgi:Holliday junction resolvase RusA-like endonuclease